MIRPFDGYVVSQEAADRVVAPVAEDLHPVERDRILATNPDTSLFLLTEDAEARSHGREYLERVTRDGTFEPTSGWWVYRITDDDHQQTGIVVEVSVAAYESDRIRRHEHTVGEIAEHVADALEEVGGSTHPVSLIYRHDPAIDDVTAGALAGSAVVPPRAGGPDTGGLEARSRRRSGSGARRHPRPLHRRRPSPVGRGGGALSPE